MALGFTFLFAEGFQNLPVGIDSDKRRTGALLLGIAHPFFVLFNQ